MGERVPTRYRRAAAAVSNSPADLNAIRRDHDLRRAADETADLIVVGGGITGAGAALDAVTRGLSVTLIEAEDLAHGTSRWSSKLVHGGLRYLATGDLATARESAQERHLLMTMIAPHLVHPLPQLLPFVPPVTPAQRVAGVAGMGLGDLLRVRARTSRTVLPRPRLVSARRARELVPALSTTRLSGGMLSFDGQLIDDARLVVAVARTAAREGARILTRVRALALHADRVICEDQISGERLELRARGVINATGVWTGALEPGLEVRPSRGTHLVLDAADLGNPIAALTVPREASISRYVFALPQGDGRVIVGLTDEDAPGPIPSVPQPTEAEIDFLLESINRVLAVPLRRAHVRGAFAGLRPLVGSPDAPGSSANVSRRHLVSTSDSGVVSVLGGKLTTYRRMAEDAVDTVARVRALGAETSRTASLRLIATDDAIARSKRVDAAEPLTGSTDVPRAAVEQAVRAEGALTAGDVLDRRTRIGLVADERERALPVVEEIVAETLQALKGGQ